MSNRELRPGTELSPQIAPPQPDVSLQVFDFFVAEFEIPGSGHEDKRRWPACFFVPDEKLLAVEPDRPHVPVVGLDLVLRPNAHEIQQVREAPVLDFVVLHLDRGVPVSTGVLPDVGREHEFAIAGSDAVPFGVGAPALGKDSLFLLAKGGLPG